MHAFICTIWPFKASQLPFLQDVQDLLLVLQKHGVDQDLHPLKRAIYAGA